MTYLEPVQLGPEFRRQMDLIFVHHDHRLMGNHRLRWWAKLLIRLHNLCLLNRLEGGRQAKKYNHNEDHHLQDERNKQTKAQYLAPRLVLAIFLLNTYLGSKGLVYHYIYDYYNYHYAKFTSAMASPINQWQLVERYTEKFDFNISKTHQVLLERINSSRLDLMACGSPYMHASDKNPFVVECTFLYICGIGWFVYLHSMIYFSFSSTPLSSRLARAITDPHEDGRHSNRVILREVNKFLASSCIFTQRELARRRFILTQRDLQVSSSISDKRDEQSAFTQVIRSYLEDCQALKTMALRGDFRLATSSPKWVDGLARIYLKFNLYSYSVYLILYVAISSFFVLVSKVSLRMDFKSNIISLTLGLNVVIILLASSHFLSLVMIMLRDQMELLAGARKKIHSFIAFNDQKLESILQRQEDWRLAKRKANDRLLAILIQHKIFVENFKSNQSLLGFISSIANGFLFLMPLLARVHATYMSGQMQIMLVLLSINHIFYIDVCLVFICSLHSRFQELQRTLASLLAHVIDMDFQNQTSSHFLVAVNQFEKSELAFGLPRYVQRYYYRPASKTKPLKAPIISQHTCWVLSQEFLNNMRLADHFHSQHLFGFTFTYASLLRAHFWLGVLLISICFEQKQDNQTLDASQEQIITRLFRDPLGIERLYL